MANNMQRLTSIIFGVGAGASLTPAAAFTIPAIVVTFVYGIIGGLGGLVFHVAYKYVKHLVETYKAKNTPPIA